jgi:hypothetical protein
MKLIALMMTILLLASCAKIGDFCDLAERLETDEATARYLLAHDRALVIEMNVQNKLLDRCP